MASIGELKSKLGSCVEECEEKLDYWRAWHESVDSYCQKIDRLLGIATAASDEDEELIAALEEAKTVVGDVATGMENAIFTLENTISYTNEYIYSL